MLSNVQITSELLKKTSLQTDKNIAKNDDMWSCVYHQISDKLLMGISSVIGEKVTDHQGINLLNYF